MKKQLPFPFLLEKPITSLVHYQIKMSYTSSITLLLLLSLFSTITISQTESKLYLKTLEQIESKQYKKALKNIDQAIKTKPQEKYIHTKIKILNALNEHPKKIIEFLGPNIRQYNTPTLYLERGMNYELLYRFQDAILDYTEAVNKAKEDSVLSLALDRRGTLYHHIRKYKLAQQDLERAYSIDSNSFSICNNLSIVLDDLNQPEEAKRLLLKIVEKDSLNYQATMNLGFLSSNNEQFEEALFYLNKALEIKPNEAYTLSNLSFVKLKLGKPKEALKDVNKSLKINKGNSYAYKNRALIYLALDMKAEACDDLNQALIYGYSEFYGPEVKELIKQNCTQ